MARAKVGGDSNLEVYRDLARQQVKHTVYQELASGEDPVLRGNS